MGFTRTFEVTVKISGKGINNYDNDNGVTTFVMKGNCKSTEKSLTNSIKRTLSKTDCKLEKVINFIETSGTPTERKITKMYATTKKAAKATAETLKVVLKAFTGMKIGTYTATMDGNTIKIVTKNGKEMEFNLDGTQKVDCKNPKFNNRIEIVAEA